MFNSNHFNTRHSDKRSLVCVIMGPLFALEKLDMITIAIIESKFRGLLLKWSVIKKRIGEHCLLEGNMQLNIQLSTY